MSNIEFKNLHWDCNWSVALEEMKSKFEQIANEMSKMYVDSCVVVVIKNCDIHGTYDTMNIHVFANFIDANNLLNNEMYEANHALDIYHYNCLKNKFTLVMNKCHDSCRFDRLAGISENHMFDDQLIFRIRKVYDTENTNIILHTMSL